MESLTFLFGRFHPLLVHLPIGILFMAFVLEVLSRFRNYKRLGVAVSPMIFWGALAASVSVVSGLALSQEGGYEDRLLNLHRNFGIATAIFSLLLYFMRRKALLHVRPGSASRRTLPRPTPGGWPSNCYRPFKSAAGIKKERHHVPQIVRQKRKVGYRSGARAPDSRASPAGEVDRVENPRQAARKRRP
jgi:hypothetical protein